MPGRRIDQLFYEITARTKGFTRGLDESQREMREFKGAAEATSRDVNRSTDSMEKSAKSLGGSFKGAAVAIGAAFAAISAAVVLRVGKQLFDLGTQVDDISTRYDRVFGPAIGSTNALLGEQARQMRLTDSEAKELLASTGGLARSMGATEERAAEVAERVQRLGADLAAFHGLRTADVIEDINAALAGEGEALRKVDIAFERAQVNQLALQQTGKQYVSDLTRMEKATAALDVVTRAAGPAVGALGRSAEDSGDKFGRIGAQVRQLKEDLATDLLPVFGQLATVLDENRQAIIAVGEAATTTSELILLAIKTLKPELVTAQAELRALAQIDLTDPEAVRRFIQVRSRAIEELRAERDALEASLPAANLFNPISTAILVKDREKLKLLNGEIRGLEIALDSATNSYVALQQAGPAGGPVDLADLDGPSDALKQLLKRLEDVRKRLADPLSEEFFLTIEIERALKALAVLEEQIVRIGRVREGRDSFVEDPGVDINLANAERQAELASQAIEQLGRDSDDWRDALLGAEGVLQATGVSIDDLHPLTRALVEEWIRLRGETEEVDSSVRDLIDDLSFAARGAVELANAVGLVDDNAASVVNQIALMGEGIGRVRDALSAKELDIGALAAGIGGIASGVAGIVGTALGESQSERELIDSQREVARRLDALTSRLDILADVLRGLPGGLSTAVRDALRDPIEALAGTDFDRGGTTTRLATAAEAALGIERALRNAGLSAADVERAADAFQFPADQLLRLLEGEGLNTAQLQEAIGQAEGLFDALDRGLAEVLDNVQTRLGFLRDSFDVLDIDDPRAQLGLYADELDRIRRETLAAGKAFALTSDEIERLRSGDEGLIEDLFREATTGTGRFTDLDLGDLSLDEFLGILRDVEGIQDRIAESLGDGGGDFQNVSAINRATSQQFDRGLALDGTRNFLLEDMRNRLRDGVPVITVTDTMLAAASTVRHVHEGRIDVTVTGDAVSVEGAAVIRDGLADALSLDRDMGEQLRRQRAGLGLPPTRTQ